VLTKLKHMLVRSRIKRREKSYRREVDRQQNRYALWIMEAEKKGRADRIRPDVKKHRFDSVVIETIPYTEMDRAWESAADILLFAEENGQLAFGAKERIVQTFLEEPGIRLLYGDEDCICRDKKRAWPWFKPEYSPDTLLSFFYFGSFFAVRKNAIADLKPLKDGTGLERVYDLVLKLLPLKPEEVGHIPEILYHAYREDLADGVTDEWVSFQKGKEYGFEPRFDHIKQQFFIRSHIAAHMEDGWELEESGLNNRVVCYDIVSSQNRTDLIGSGSQEAGREPLVSVIIPSKDHPEILRRCIRSLREKTLYDNYEIIVIDNGSREENKAVIEKMAETERFYYHYEAMEFNFSRMCNIGVSLSKGSYILLLNDDMGILEPEWMSRMLGQAMQEKTGAVGAKLLYPGNKHIQHTGITNMTVGPSHKLIDLSDKEDYYYGRNHLNYNVIGVTAACLMIDKAIYEKVGGMPEQIQVAYNDVEFCMRVYEAGYRNVVRNDVVLYHYESLSRGDDRLDEKKLLRLLQEKEEVRKLHVANMEKDPFYSPNLAGYRIGYDCSFCFGYEKREVVTGYSKYAGTDPAKWENNCLTISMEHAGEEDRTDIRDTSQIILIEGWSYVLGMDNCRYQRFLLLTSAQGETLKFAVTDRYRKDVVKILPQEKNVELAGFVVRIPKAVLAGKEWKIALLAKDTCSRQRLYKECEEILCI